MAPHETDTRQRIRVSFVQSELSPALDRQLNADHNCPLDTCTQSHAPQRASSGRILSGCAFSARTPQSPVSPSPLMPQMQTGSIPCTSCTGNARTHLTVRNPPSVYANAAEGFTESLAGRWVLYDELVLCAARAATSARLPPRATLSPCVAPTNDCAMAGDFKSIYILSWFDAAVKRLSC